MSLQPLATIAILSIGQMGLGIARLLASHNYPLITNVSDRSPSTQDRAKSASITCLASDIEVVKQADYILSIVPPRDAVATAQRIVDTLNSKDGVNVREKAGKKEPLYYLDLNAIAPSTAREIDNLFKKETPSIRFIDGGIIGSPPSPPSSSSPPSTPWTRPGIPLSGPYPLTDSPIYGSELAELLNTRFVGTEIGAASGLKCTFAALSKGFTALSLQSYTTASSLGVLPDLQHYLDIYNPNARQKAERSIVGCPPKAYRWLEEMRQIGLCFEEDGGWGKEANVFQGVAGVFGELAEVVEKRGGTEGMTNVGKVEDAVEILRKGLKEGRVTKKEINELLGD
ncbi:6-phosphogluconate dehydrogenase C-terminal domain-like protein [Byssothecium circinans]|uniref:6-phosphogluconate dehydrogenase C-terminal domain-like protein n=1 Tax=Byssothecium circinans TaxID=147558 RepID=A0A6A5U126_9PLEO|nr:6-phosphogluconate dehydrogenase C-terminal domain-like protein [Byssothecium circinans]